MSAVTEVRAPRGRRVGAWVGIGAVVLIVAVLGTLLAGGTWAQRDALDPDSYGPTGARGVVELLRGQGVEVVVAKDRMSAASALASTDATLALPDAPALSDDAISELAEGAADVVLLDPRSRTLRLLLPGSALAGSGTDDPVDPACDLAEAQRPGAIAPGALFEPSDGVTACYDGGDGWGLLVRSEGELRRTAVDGFTLFTNESLAENGNAALALNLLGRHATVVWYVPSVADSDLTGAPTLGELTPPWVSPVIVLLLATAVAAGIWRGRRFGPLVAERLPVTVRASETTEGRARLYARSQDALHAADQLRIGALGRIARRLALGPAASATEIADAAAARTGWDRARVHDILLDDLPATGAQLVALHEALRTLEAAVHQATRPSPEADRA